MKRILPVACAALLILRPMAALATPEYYRLDRPHTQILFSVNHLGFIETFGKFTNYKGGFTLDRARPERSSVDVTIMTGSIDMGDGDWDNAVKARGYFDVAHYPTMTFHSTRFEKTGRDTAKVTGDLTLLGVTKDVTFNMRLNRVGRHPFMERYVAGLSGEGVLNRSDFGMTGGLPLIGDEVTIHLEVEGDRVEQPGQEMYNQ